MMHPALFSHRRRGTTLVEVLVVIVVFLIGILAIAQIFPGGIKILARTRNQSMALSLARAQVEELKARPDLVPEAVLPIVYQDSGGVFVPVVDATKLVTDYAPTGTGITQAGLVPEAGRDWQLVSGANTFRRIIGETHVIPAPKALTTDPTSVTAHFGSLVVVERGPIARDIGVPADVTFQVYGRDMAGRVAREVSDFTGLREFEYLYDGMNTTNASVYLPAPTDLLYRVSVNLVVNNAGQINRRQIVGNIIRVNATPTPGYTQVRLDDVSTYGFLNAGETLVAAEPGSLKIARVYERINTTDAFQPNFPFTYKLLNDRIGMVLLNPALANRYEERPGASRAPYIARIDYDVRDWRILHEDFRISTSLPANLPKNIRLPIPGLKTNTQPGADGRNAITHAAVVGGNDVPSQSMEDVFVASNADVPNANEALADNFLVIDLATGGQLAESVGGAQAIKVDKSTGVVTFLDADGAAGNGLTQNIIMLDGSVVPTNITGRVLRVFFMGKDEWAVQLLRNPATYTSTLGLPGAGQFYVGGSNPALGGLPTRIYFPRMDTNRKVSFGKIRYVLGGTAQVMEGVEFTVQNRAGADTISTPMPSIDIREINPGITSFVADSGAPASYPFAISDVHGVSVLVRVFFNSDKFNLTGNAATNLSNNFNNWSQMWNITSKETYLNQGESSR